MADRPRESDWWLASDGKWYPPNLGPDSRATEFQQDRATNTEIPPALTGVLSLGLLITSAVLIAAAYAAVRYATAVQKYSGILSDVEMEALEPVAFAWASWAGLAMLLLIFTGVLVIVWTHASSRSLDNRGSAGRRWRGGWTMWGWFIPIANLLIPKLVFNEIEKIAQVPYRDTFVGEDWKSQQRSQLGDVWWLLWIGGVIPSQILQILMDDPTGDATRLATMLNINAFTYVLFAGAGVALATLLRRIERASRS